ncbi:hypothetical protein Ait01nite_007200 [Actinoplanes italicus]|uniref:Uncharacterized protein n=1 Tax=Actinoplanes italicus TaxID=113567 RepID=A0A2T0KLU3_9ACTN|nr:hypothetical protein CLV67_102375 [Actinoplanes italicus]GIE27675.1 hypothetical protein Ait01nite_007200 [Actinoplanes italicus]
MRRSAKFLLMVAVVIAMGTGGTVLAYAGGWILPDNKATLAAGVAAMPRGVKPSVAKQSGQAVVVWPAQEIAPGSLMDRYVVTAHHTGASTKPDIARTVVASGNATESVTFTGAELAGGTWNWTIRPKFQEWIGAASGKSHNLAFPVAPVARSATPGDSATASPTSGSSRSPATVVSSSRPAAMKSPASDGTKAPEKQPETTTPEPVKSDGPPPQPFESSSGEAPEPPAEK